MDDSFGGIARAGADGFAGDEIEFLENRYSGAYYGATFLEYDGFDVGFFVTVVTGVRY